MYIKFYFNNLGSNRLSKINQHAELKTILQLLLE
jgi:hypothetical protein